jgi:hypothetical protein
LRSAVGACSDIDHSRATMEVLQTALVTSRQTLTRLVGLQATLEAEISTQQKQLVGVQAGAALHSAHPSTQKARRETHQRPH